MFLNRSEYDRGVNTFSPDGRLFQVEYAIEAIKLGSTAIGIQTREGVLLACEKRINSTLLVPSSVEKILEINYNIICAISGLTSDGKNLIEHARSENMNHFFTYNEYMSVESVTQSIGDLALRFGEDRKHEKAMSRPFGVALLICGVDYDTHEPSLWHADPSGTFLRYDAKAIGAGAEAAQQALQEEYHRSLSLHDAELMALKILRSVMEEKINDINIEVASVTLKEGRKGPEPKIEFYGKEKIEALIGELPEAMATV